MKTSNKVTLASLVVVAGTMLAGCERDAQVASRNLSKAGDMFEIQRRIVFYNGISGEYMLTIEGRCSISHGAGQLEVTCKTSQDAFKKHFLGLSDNVTYFAEQLEAADVSTYHNRIIWKPQSIIPNIDINTDADELIDAVTPD